jgi:hypothetical protein
MDFNVLHNESCLPAFSVDLRGLLRIHTRALSDEFPKIEGLIR